jgi:hypothetical protein
MPHIFAISPLLITLSLPQLDIAIPLIFHFIIDIAIDTPLLLPLLACAIVSFMPPPLPLAFAS